MDDWLTSQVTCVSRAVEDRVASFAALLQRPNTTHQSRFMGNLLLKRKQIVRFGEFSASEGRVARASVTPGHLDLAFCVGQSGTAVSGSRA